MVGCSLAEGRSLVILADHSGFSGAGSGLLQVPDSQPTLLAVSIVLNEIFDHHVAQLL